MTEQPEALRLAQHINDLFVSEWGMNSPMANDSKIVLDELRRLHAANKELLNAVRLIASAENSALDLAYCKGIARGAIARAEGNT